MSDIGNDNSADNRDRSEREKRSGGNTGCSILIKNLRNDIDIMKLREKVSEYGSVKDVYIPRDYEKNRPKSFAFVEYEDQSSANTAKNAMNNLDFDGKTLEVFIANTGRKNKAEMRSQYGGRDDRRRRDDYRRDDRGRRDYDDRGRRDYDDRGRPDYDNRRGPDYDNRRGPDYDNRRGPDYDNRRGPDYDERRRPDYVDMGRRDYDDRGRREYDDRRRSDYDDRRGSDYDYKRRSKSRSRDRR